MSCNRENVMWQNEDGTWSRGFYAYYDVGDPSSEDWDHEWDVEYEDYFWTVTFGHPSEDAAWKAWHGSNPGTYSAWKWSEDNRATIARFQELAQAVKDRGTYYDGWWS